MLALGMDRRAVDRHLAAGEVLAVHAGAYAFGHRALPRGWRQTAAALSAGEDAVLSHRSAGAWLGLLGWWDGHVHVTIPRQTGRGPSSDGIVVHRCRTLLPRDVAVHDGLRCTTPARTLVDLAATAPRLLPRALREAEVQRLDVGTVHVLLAEHPRRRGARALRAALAAFDPGTADARSPLEHDALDLIRRAGLPPAQANVLVCGHLVDLLWPREKVVVELDGRRTHATPSAFEEDRRRDIALQLAGYLVLRLTARRLREEARAVVGELSAALAARGAAPPA